MSVHKVYKFQVYPTDQQTIIVNKTIGCCRFVLKFLVNKKQTRI